MFRYEKLQWVYVLLPRTCDVTGGTLNYVSVTRIVKATVNQSCIVQAYTAHTNGIEMTSERASLYPTYVKYSSYCVCTHVPFPAHSARVSVYTYCVFLCCSIYILYVLCMYTCMLARHVCLVCHYKCVLYSGFNFKQTLTELCMNRKFIYAFYGTFRSGRHPMNSLYSDPAVVVLQKGLIHPHLAVRKSGDYLCGQSMECCTYRFISMSSSYSPCVCTCTHIILYAQYRNTNSTHTDTQRSPSLGL